ncbi:MAG: hypothetical protein HY896_03465 [Deltaproteobacteria bacterium]|nr:hypothetical protein [Deltaproteobacteria bacterium]
MIKIVSGQSIPVGSTVALANLCNQLNSRGHECVFYGPDRWHMDKCLSAPLSDFRPVNGDIVIAHGIRLHSASDLDDPAKLAGTSRGGGWRKELEDRIPGVLAGGTKPDAFRLILTRSGDDPVLTGRPRFSIFHKIHFSCESQRDRGASRFSHFVCPDFVRDLEKPAARPERVAGVIGTVRRENRLETSIEKALRDGMESVVLYGYMLDPVYFNSNIAPLSKTYPGRIKFAGFVDDPRKMYDSISDVYRCAARPWSPVKRECALTGTRYHGPDTAEADESASNDSIYEVWKKELDL